MIATIQVLPSVRGVATTRKPAHPAFNRGYHTFHTEEIEAGKQLHAAIKLMLGESKARRLLRRDAGAAFRPLRYGRRWLCHNDTTGVCVMIDHAPFFHGKASTENIIVPGRPGWRRLALKVKELTGKPRWAEGLTATAEALDDLGFAIAESVAAMLCWRLDSDEMVGSHATNPSAALTRY